MIGENKNKMISSVLYITFIHLNRPVGSFPLLPHGAGTPMSAIHIAVWGILGFVQRMEPSSGDCFKSDDRTIGQVALRLLRGCNIVRVTLTLSICERASYPLT